MAFNGFDEADYLSMRKPGTKLLLTLPSGLSNVATVISYDDTTQLVTLRNDKNQFMNQELQDRLSDGEFSIDLREYQHHWIDSDAFYCYACHTMELDRLFVCNHESHGLQRVAFHDRCLDKQLNHVIPTNDTLRTWICPMHNNKVLAQPDPSSLRARPKKGDYDFDFDRPIKKRRISVPDPDWLQLPDGTESVYPRHIPCEYCVSEGLIAECDGNRPCNQCCRYVRDEVMDMTQQKFISMNEQEIQSEIDSEAITYCKNRRPSFYHFEHDIAMRKWLEIHDHVLYQRYVQEKREKDHLKEEETALDRIDEDDDLKTTNAPTAAAAVSNERDDLVQLKLNGFKAPEFVSSVPIFARYQCGECHELFGDKYRWKMHQQWAHQTVTVAQSALRTEKILAHAQCEKPLKYACPYAGCLRGANNSDEIEDHILRHHDITDPTKPRPEAEEKKQEKSKEKGLGTKVGKQSVNRNDVRLRLKREHPLSAERGIFSLFAAGTHQRCSKRGDALFPISKVTVEGVAYLTVSQKREISKVWHESKATRIDKENSINLIKNFVSAIVDDQLDRFDQTTKMLQRKYATDMEIIAANNQKEARLAQSSHVPRVDLLPIPPQQLIVPEEQVETPSGPKSLWQ